MDVDFVDVNMGCPIDLVCNAGAGSALMQRPNKVKQIVRGLTSTLSCSITLKMRTGWNEKKPVAHELMRAAEELGNGRIAAFMLHGRSRLQRYSKAADWSYIGKVAHGASCSCGPIEYQLLPRRARARAPFYFFLACLLLFCLCPISAFDIQALAANCRLRRRDTPYDPNHWQRGHFLLHGLGRA